MAISKGSMIPHEACNFTVAVEQYDDTKMEFLVYEGEQEEGVRCGSFAELAVQMEQGFDAMHYPTPSVQKRRFRPGRKTVSEETLTPAQESLVTARQDGRLGTFRIRVQQCLHATWQGWVGVAGDEASYCAFESFLELIELLDRMIIGGATSTEETETAGQALHSECAEAPLADTLERALLLGGRYSGISVGARDTTEVLVCARTLEDGSRETFVIQPMFDQNHTIQGVVHWSEGRQKKNFRSFLELLTLLMSAVGKQDPKDQEEE